MTHVVVLLAAAKEKSTRFFDLLEIRERHQLARVLEEGWGTVCDVGG